MSSKIGIHSIRPNKVISFVAQAKLKGVKFIYVKAVDDTGTAIEVKKLSPDTITETRFVTPNDAMQGLEKWTPADRVNFAKAQLDILKVRTNNYDPIIMANTNFWEIINEASPKGFYDLYGLALIELVNEANRRNIKLALPAFNAGTPEWDDINKIRNTGLFRLMKQTGHILSIHEGVFGTQPVNQGYGDIIPGAPKVDGAGSLCFRYKYLYSLLGPDERVNCVVSEFRASGGNLGNDETVARMKWYDQLAQKDDYILAFLPFTIDPVPNWTQADYTSNYDAIIDYMVTQINSPTPQPVPQPVPQPTTQLVGLHGRADGRMQPADFLAVQTGKIEAVKLLSTASPDDVTSLKITNPNMFIMVRLFASFQNRALTPQQFVDSVKVDMQNFYNKGVRYFEIHNEPNVYAEGYNTSWKNGSDFTVWFNTVYRVLKSQFPDAQLGFPGVSPGLDVAGVRANSAIFLSQLGIITADWIGAHIYWQDQAGLDSANVSTYTRFNKPIYITEFSNTTDVDKTTKANQYLQFYDKNLSVAAFCFVVSASQGFNNEVWRDENGNLTVIPTIVGERIMSWLDKKVTNKNNFLNVRSGPGTNFSIVGTLGLNSIFTDLEEHGNWVRITTTDWVSKSYLSLV